MSEANPIKWINPSLQTGFCPSDSQAKAIGWPSADILIYMYIS